MRNNQPALRLFACMKTRTDGRPSCGARCASKVIFALREEIEKRGLAASHIDVRPTGCVDRCEDGPVLLGFTGPVAEQADPPRKLCEELLKSPTVVFECASVEQVPAIVDKLLGPSS